MSKIAVETRIGIKCRCRFHKIQHKRGPAKRTLFSRTTITVPQQSPRSNADLRLGDCSCHRASKVDSNINNMPGLCIHSACEDVDQASLPKANAALSQRAVTCWQFKARLV